MHEYYRPSVEPSWVNDDWVTKNTSLVPGETPLEEFVAAGFYEVKRIEPTTNLCPNLYNFIWADVIESPYCVQSVVEIKPLDLDFAKKWMLGVYPDYEAQILAATSVDELQQLLDSIPPA